jgi:exopolysaccharide biosynthesis polyprenyl glycosylphosphotransferase
MNLSRKKRQLFIAFVDVIILVFALYMTLWVRRPHVSAVANFLKHASAFIPVMAAWLVCLYTAGFYSLEPHSGIKKLTHLSIIAVICTLLGLAFFSLNREARILPKSILVIYTAFVFALVAAWRWFFDKVFTKYFSKINIGFIGMGSTVVELLDERRHLSYMSYRPLFLFDEQCQTENYDGIPVISGLPVLVDTIKKSGVRTLVFSDDTKMPQTGQEILFELLRRNIHCVSLVDFYEIFLRRVPLAAIDELWFLKNIDLRSKGMYRRFKRAGDRFVAAVLLGISAPFWPFIMLIIKLDSRGSALFAQERAGYLGAAFTLLKFRTMRTENNTHEPARRNDPRITRVGRLLRKTRVDEIPQLINIVKGEMSFIGPRPERPELIQTLEQDVPFYRQRLLVEPGLSGWDQVSGEYHSASKEDTYKKLQHDLYYIKNMSFFLDVSIFFKTLVTMVKKLGI